MERIDTPRTGVVEFRDVPVAGGAAHHGGAYLHLDGLARDRTTALVGAFLLVPGFPEVTVSSGPEHPGYLGEAAVYLSPPGPGSGAADPASAPDQGSYEVLLDVGERFGALAPPGPVVDLALTVRDPAGSDVGITVTDNFRAAIGDETDPVVQMIVLDQDGGPLPLSALRFDSATVTIT